MHKANYSLNELQAINACLEDAVVFRDMFLRILDLPLDTKSLISLGFISESAMFIVESYECLKKVAPDIANILDSTLINELKILRHRSKLLESKKDIKEVLKILSEIEHNNIKEFRELHTGCLSFFYKMIQPDIGLTKCNNHIITTSHSTEYFLCIDINSDLQRFKDLAFKVGEYVENLASLTNSQQVINVSNESLENSKFTMFDLKTIKLLKLSKFDENNKKYTKALLLILARLNFTKLVTSKAFPVGSLALFRTKFINTFHAVSSLNTLQAIIRKEGSSATENDFFKSVCGEENAKWINKQSSLRNFLTHYLLDKKQLKRMDPLFTREDVIHKLSGDIPISEMERRLDIIIENITINLEGFLDIQQDSFWLNKI